MKSQCNSILLLQIDKLSLKDKFGKKKILKL